MMVSYSFSEKDWANVCLLLCCMQPKALIFNTNCIMEYYILGGIRDKNIIKKKLEEMGSILKDTPYYFNNEWNEINI